jgi:hypothetical protein
MKNMTAKISTVILSKRWPHEFWRPFGEAARIGITQVYWPTEGALLSRWEKFVRRDRRGIAHRSLFICHCEMARFGQ